MNRMKIPKWNKIIAIKKEIDKTNAYSYFIHVHSGDHRHPVYIIQYNNNYKEYINQSNCGRIKSSFEMLQTPTCARISEKKKTTTTTKKR